jgi:hypothetical protein
MPLYIYIFLIIYFSVNLFFAGYLFANDQKWYIALTALLFGWFIVMYGLIAALLTVTFRFWIEYIFTKRWNNLKHDHLTRLNTSGLKNHDTNKLKDKIFRKCVKLINKRNNFIPIILFLLLLSSCEEKTNQQSRVENETVINGYYFATIDNHDYVSRSASSLTHLESCRCKTKCISIIVTLDSIIKGPAMYCVSKSKTK